MDRRTYSGVAVEWIGRSTALQVGAFFAAVDFFWTGPFGSRAVLSNIDSVGSLCISVQYMCLVILQPARSLNTSFAVVGSFLQRAVLY